MSNDNINDTYYDKKDHSKDKGKSFTATIDENSWRNAVVVDRLQGTAETAFAFEASPFVLTVGVGIDI